MMNWPSRPSSDDGSVHALLLARDELEGHGLRLGVSQHAEDLVVRGGADQVGLWEKGILGYFESIFDLTLNFIYKGWLIRDD